MQSVSGVDASSAEVRARVLSAAKKMAGIIQSAADSVAADADGPAKAEALRWKSNAITSLQEAALINDPLLAALDVWALSLQNRDFVRQFGQQAFGDKTSTVTRASDNLVGVAAELKDRVVASNDFAFNETSVTFWASEHPIETTHFIRESILGARADVFDNNSRNPFASVASMEQSLDGLNARLSFTNEYLLKQIEWRTELGAHQLAQALDENSALQKWELKFDSLNQFVMDTPNLVHSERALILDWLTNERKAALRSIDIQRIATIETLIDQQSFVENLFRAERMALVSSLRAERVATFEEIDVMFGRQLQTVEAMLNRLLLKVAVMMVVAIIVVGLIALIATRRWKQDF